MKISEMTTEQGADILLALTPIITDFASDDEFKNIFTVTEDKDSTLLGAERLEKVVKYLLKNKRETVFELLGLMNGKTASEIAKQSFIKTAIQVKDLVKDKELLDFFKSFASLNKTE